MRSSVCAIWAWRTSFVSRSLLSGEMAQINEALDRPGKFASLSRWT